eukprot:TRINITY_DN26098_c0_g1_i1.p1 TRINITY_DN26098_c0_g1~~TRINITY_DN26098_c0_g1_i1.p1  ORF type:complete len:556 (-),score=64.58 TRINITY_DN26098_c0_g1_i1:22-1689(-)
MAELQVQESAISRFMLWEFRLRAVLVVSTLFLYLCPQYMAQMSEICTNNRRCWSYLRPSWINGREIDAADIQWRELRGSLHLLSLAAAAHVLVRAALGRRRVWPCLMLSAAFVGYLHGGHTLFLLLASSLSFGIGKYFGSSKWNIYVTWIYGITLIACKVLSMNLKLSMFLGPLGGFLDGLPRAYDWHQSLSLLTLRLISFNLDYHWALKAAEDKDVKEAFPSPSSVSTSDSQVETLPYKVRERRHRPLEEYNLTNCLAHAFYGPCWLAGPTIGFNCFISHIHDRSQEAVIGWRLVLYAIRFIFALSLLELALHYAPVFALARSQAYFELMESGAELAAGYVFIMLNVMWLKFLVIWRFARLWALCDGVEVVENMQRCMCNNFSIIGFWKGWHVSFNRWLVRYLYIPLGGRRYRWANVWVVFGFVAMWHDAELKLLVWGMLNACFVAIEHLAASSWQSQKLTPLREGRPVLAKWVKASAGTTYIYIMFFVNLVGYGIGVSGTVSITQTALFTSVQKSIPTLFGSFFILFTGVQIMFELRDLGIVRENEGEVTKAS